MYPIQLADVRRQNPTTVPFEQLPQQPLELPSQFSIGYNPRSVKALIPSENGHWVTWLGNGNGVGLFNVRRQQIFVLFEEGANANVLTMPSSNKSCLQCLQEVNRNILKAYVHPFLDRVTLPE